MLAASPHEEFKERNAILESKHLFSSEEVLDQIIAKDDYLDALYLVQLNKVLEQLKPETLQKKIIASFIHFMQILKLLLSPGMINIQRLILKPWKRKLDYYSKN
jgi:hypothetical protein